MEVTPLTQRIGERIERARKRRRFSRAKLANKINHPRGGAAIHDLEMGNTSLTVCELDSITTALGIPIHYALGDDALIDWLSERRVAQLYSLLDHQQRAAVGDFLEALVAGMPCYD